jgi:hypothetical protein
MARHGSKGGADGFMNRSRKGVIHARAMGWIRYTAVFEKPFFFQPALCWR